MSCAVSKDGYCSLSSEVGAQYQVWVWVGSTGKWLDDETFKTISQLHHCDLYQYRGRLIWELTSISYTPNKTGMVDPSSLWFNHSSTKSSNRLCLFYLLMSFRDIIAFYPHACRVMVYTYAAPTRPQITQTTIYITFFVFPLGGFSQQNGCEGISCRSPPLAGLVCVCFTLLPALTTVVWTHNEGCGCLSVRNTSLLGSFQRPLAFPRVTHPWPIASCLPFCLFDSLCLSYPDPCVITNTAAVTHMSSVKCIHT